MECPVEKMVALLNHRSIDTVSELQNYCKNIENTGVNGGNTVDDYDEDTNNRSSNKSNNNKKHKSKSHKNKSKSKEKSKNSSKSSSSSEDSESPEIFSSEKFSLD